MISSAQSSSRSGEEPIWKKIWTSPCPTKVKHFLWRMAHESHPLRCSLARWGMDISTICPVCGRDNEDGTHLFFKCILAKQVWNLLALEDTRKKLAAQFSAIEALSVILEAKESSMTLMAITLWSLWSNRNAVCEGYRGKKDADLARSFRVYANEISQQGRLDRPQRNPTKAEWRKPPEGFLKLNCDVVG